MSLKLHLKPGEKIIVGGAVLKCGHRPIEFTVENNVPILRQKDILTEAGVTTPARQVYFLLQLMYIDRDSQKEQLTNSLHQLAQQITSAAPSCVPFCREIDQHVAADDLYHALKTAQALISHEEKLLTAASVTAG